MLHIIQRRHRLNPVAQGGMGGYVLDPFAADPNFTRVVL